MDRHCYIVDAGGRTYYAQTDAAQLAGEIAAERARGQAADWITLELEPGPDVGTFRQYLNPNLIVSVGDTAPPDDAETLIYHVAGRAQSG